MRHLGTNCSFYVIAVLLLVAAESMAAAPNPTGVVPNNGPSTGGTAVTISGTNFEAGATVTFGGTPATSVVVVNATTITATTPAHSAGPVNVRGLNGNQPGTLNNGYSYNAAAAPTVISLNPNTGPAAGATSVTITGTNFVSGVSVTYGGTTATSVVVVDAATITCLTPAHAAGAVDVTVTNPDAQSATLAGGFTYTGSGGPTGGGAFRFLTASLPRGSTNVVYAATLVTANAGGPVTYAVSSGSLPPGLTLDPLTGFISGIPTVVDASGTPVTFSANDGTSTILFPTSIAVNAAGGGGNTGLSFVTQTLPDGRVGAAYSQTVVVTGGSVLSTGLAQIVFGATDLPPGLSLNGLTGVVSGTPAAAGTFFVTFTATDKGENNNKVIQVVPLTVLPAASDFRFTTLLLDNGQVGTAYSDTLRTNAVSGVTFGATGLPPGLSLDPATGTISGTPTKGGTFLVNLSASNGTDTITMNRAIIIAPSATSGFYWVFTGLPTGFLNQPYAPPSPPILLVTQNPGPGGGAVYSASGLPPGIAYDPVSGAFSGTPLEAGIFPVTFTATDSSTGNQIVLSIDFVVLPPNGGDANSLPINLWVSKQALKKTGDAGKDSWQAQFIYNADRRTGKRFDSTKDTLSIALGALPEVNITPPTNVLTGTAPKFSFKSAKGVLPAVAVKLDESGQKISLAAKGETVTDTLPGVLRNTVKLGNKSYRLDLFFDAKGKFTPALGYRKTAFVVASAKLNTKTAGKSSAAFAMLLGDPAFQFPATSGSKAARFRVLNSSGAVVLDKEFSSLLTVTESTDKLTGAKIFKLKSGKDATAPQIRFAYDSKSGKMLLGLKGATLTALTAAEEHVSVELTLADKIYFTAVTLFAPRSGSYSTKLGR